MTVCAVCEAGGEPMEGGAYCLLCGARWRVPVSEVERAVLAERARCAAVCREVAGFYFAEDVGSVVAHACADTIERGPVTP